MLKKIVVLLVFFFYFLFSPLTASGAATGTMIGSPAEIIKPATIAVQGDYIYIAEKSAVHVYSRHPFKHLKQFGRKGEGPGEFKYTPLLTPYDDFLLINNWGKLMFYSPDGSLQKETKLPFNYFYLNFPLLPIEGNYAGFQMKVEKTGSKPTPMFVLKLYGPGLELVKEFGKKISPYLPPPPPPGVKPAQKMDFPVISGTLDFAIAGDKIFVADTNNGFFISVYDSTGSHLYDIEKEYKKIPVPGKFKENFMKKQQARENWEQLKSAYNYIFPKYYPAFSTFKVRDGKIYAATYEKENNNYKLVVMDLKGKELKSSFVFPINPQDRALWGFPLLSTEFDISNGHIYYLQENEDEETWELHAARI